MALANLRSAVLFRLSSTIRRLLAALVRRGGVEGRLYLAHAGINVEHLIPNAPR
jgi:predicted sulfurtransferase